MLEYATLGQMADQVGRQTQATDSTSLTRAKEIINRHYSTLAREHRWPQLLRVSEERASTTIGQKYLYLPKEVEQVYLVFPQNGMPPLQGRSLDRLIEEFQNLYSQNGLTIEFGEAGEVGYCTDYYTTGETLTITHSGTGTIEAVVHGLVGGAEGLSAATEKVETVSVLQSTGGVTTNTFTDLIAVSCAELAADDVVTVTGTTTARTYAKIATGERTARYKRLRLMQPSQTSDAYTIVWKKHVLRLTTDNQVVEIPVGDVLIDMAVSTMLANQRQYDGATLHYQAAKAAMEQLKSAAVVDGASVQLSVPSVDMRRGYRSGGNLGMGY